MSPITTVRTTGTDMTGTDMTGTTLGEAMDVLQGERLIVVERVVVAPATGMFRPSELIANAVPSGEFAGTMSVPVHQGTLIGTIEGPGTSEAVISRFDGEIIGVLAEPGERVREGQPVAWLRIS